MKKVLLKAPILTQSGYGHHSRTVLRALRSREDLFDIYIQPINWGQTSWLADTDEERLWIDAAITKTVEYAASGGIFDASLQISIPNEWEKIAPVNIGVTAGIETTKVSPKWIEKSYLMDKIITISKHSKDSYVNTVYRATNNKTNEEIDFRTQVPVDYVSYPVYEYEADESVKLDLKTSFNFLSVAQISPRKNLTALIKNFIDCFRENEDVGLILKTNIAKNSIIDRTHTLNNLRNMINSLGDRKCKIYLLHGRLNDHEMSAIYKNPKVKAFVSTTHGEGFGLPIFESAYYGLPVAATDWSGHLDFLYKTTKQKNGKTKNKHMFSRISYNLAPIQPEAVWDGVLQKDSMWAYPEDGSIKMNLEEIYKDYGRFKKRAKELQKWICTEFSQENQYKKYVDSILEVLPIKSEDDWMDEISSIVKEYE
tara:strand:- start:22858 stop:24132 length:1275 start_codon:yes stop_codon:yes gene_type:complete